METNEKLFGHLERGLQIIKLTTTVRDSSDKQQVEDVWKTIDETIGWLKENNNCPSK